MYDLDLIINEFIRIFVIKEFCLDVILINVLVFVRKLGVIEIGLSDYLFVYVILNSKIFYFKLEIVVK